MSEPIKFTIEEAHKKFAKLFNGRVWELLEMENRSRADDEELLLAQSASFYHWQKAGTIVHEQRGYWLFSRIYAVLNRPAKALDYAQRCMDITKSNLTLMKDFDIAYAHEALARAYALNGDIEQAKDHHQKAKEAGTAISDPEDKEIFMGDLQAGSWPGIA